MAAVLLTGGRSRRRRTSGSTSKRRFPSSSTRRRRRVSVSVPKIRSRRRRRGVSAASSVLGASSSAPGLASASERAALQNLATRLQRGNYTAWRSADPSVAASEAARAAASTGNTALVEDLSTGITAEATPLTGTGRRRRVSRRSLKGGFLPALIPIIAAAIGAIPGIAGTAVGIANLQEQKRQFNKMYGNQK